MKDNARLKACLREIEHVMNKYDAGGYVILADAEGGEYKFINPKWSVYNEFSADRGWIKHRVATHEQTERTVHMLQVIRDASANAFMFTSSIIDQVDKHMPIEGGPIPL